MGAPVEFHKVVVIGAGISGLYAARELRKHIDDVVIVEASNHVGGRIRQVEGVAPWPIEIGPEFIHGGDNSLLMDVVNEMGLETREHEWPDRYYFGGAGGGRMVDANSGEDDPEAERLFELFDNIDEDPVEQDMRADDWLRMRGANSKMMELAEVCYANDFGCSLRHMGTAQLKEENKAWDYGHAYLTLRTSLAAVVEHLARGQEVRRGWAVAEVKYGGACGNVLLRNERGEVLQCGKCVITVPLTILKGGDIAFSPPLPRDKARAIERIGIGNAVKIIIGFSAPFWPEGMFDAVCTGCFMPEIWMTTYDPAPGGPRGPAACVITGFACGDICDRILALPEAEAVELFMRQLNTMFAGAGGGGKGGATPAHHAYVTHRVVDWSKEQYIRGAYSYPTHGAEGCQKVLAMPLNNRLFWAGEASHEGVNPCLQGAMETGRRAAAQVLGALTMAGASRL